MSHRSYASPLIIPLRTSRSLRLVYAACASAATLSIWLTDLDWSVQLIFTLLLALYAAGRWRNQAALYGRHAELVWDNEGRWWLHGNGDVVELQLLDESYVSAFLLVLRFAPIGGGGDTAYILLPDNLDSETRRRLRVRLAITRPGGDDQPA